MILPNGDTHPDYLIACDPGADGAYACFSYEQGRWGLDTYIRTTEYQKLAPLDLYPAIGVIEFNHGIAGQGAGRSFTQGLNQGMEFRTLQTSCIDVIKTIPQRWMKTFGVPVKASFEGSTTDARGRKQKAWTREKCEKALGIELPNWAGDAVAIGLAYIKELKNA